MHEQLRRASVVGVVGLVGLSLVVTSGGSAQAFAPAPPVPITVTSGVMAGSMDSATAAQRAAAVGNVAKGAVGGWNVPVSTSGNILKASAGAPSPFTVGVAGFFIGFEGANQVMRLMGVDDVGIGALGTQTASVDYTLNADVVVHQPGWSGGNVFMLQTSKGPVPVTVNVVSAPAYNATGLTTIATEVPWPAGLSGTDVADMGTAYTFVVPGASANMSQWLSNRSSSSPVFYASFSKSLSSSLAFTGMTVRRDSTVNALTAGSVWYPVGSPLRPADSVPDPGRQFETRWTCTEGVGGTLRSPQFFESDVSWPAFPQARCAAGSVASMSVWEVPALGTEPPAVQLTTWTAAPQVTEWQTANPDCTDGSCTLELSRIDPTTGARLSCFGSPEACVDWWSSPNRATEYVCSYNGAPVAVTECAAYGPTFNKSTGAAVETAAGPIPAVDAMPYGDPATGEGVPSPEPSMPVTQPSPDCPPPFEFTLGGMGYWVAKGVTCALSAAFVPPDGIDTSGIDQAFAGSPLRQIGDMFSGVGGSFGAMSSGACGVIVDTAPAPLQGERLVISTCDPPWDQVAPLRLLISAGFMIGAVVSGTKVLLGTLRVTVHSEPTGEK